MSTNEHSQPSKDAPQPKNKVFRNIFIGVAILLVLKVISYNTHGGAEYGSMSQTVLKFIDTVIPWPSSSQNYEQEQSSVEAEIIEDASDSEEYLTDAEEVEDEDLSAYNGDYLYKTKTFSEAAIFYNYYDGHNWDLSEALDSIIYNVPDGHQVYVLKKIDDEVAKVYCDGHIGFIDKTLLRD